jgi:hypothetical protein
VLVLKSVSSRLLYGKKSNINIKAKSPTKLIAILMPKTRSPVKIFNVLNDKALGLGVLRKKSAFYAYQSNKQQNVENYCNLLSEIPIPLSLP